MYRYRARLLDDSDGCEGETMVATCISDIFRFCHRVMNLEMDETEYYDDEPYDMTTDEEAPYEDNEG